MISKLRRRIDSETLDRVRTAVGETVEPVLDHRLDELGMVGDISATGDGVRITVRIASTSMPEQDRLRADVAQAAEAVDGVGAAEVSLEPMSEADRMQIARVLRAAPGPTSLGSSTRVYAIASGKGGVGKSVVTANLAASLASTGLRVGVIDADVWGYSIPQLLGASGPPVAIKGIMLPVQAHNVRVMSVGFFVDESQPVVWRGPMLHKALEQFVSDVYWGELDVLLLDLPPGTGDVPMSLIEFLPDLQLVLVTTPQEAVATVARRIALMAKESRVPTAAVIENMASVDCQGCGTRTPLFGTGAGSRLADELEVPLLGQIPLDPQLMSDADAGTPAVLEHPDTPAAVELTRVGADMPDVKPAITGRPLPLFVSGTAG